MRGSAVDSVLDWLRRHALPEAALHRDSRLVQTGDVFFACPGRQSDGRLYVLEAVARGAAAVVVQTGSPYIAAEVTVPVLPVDNLAAILGELAHVWCGRASEQMTVIAVTGTNGKTTTTQWLATALCAAGVPCGAIGTLGVVFPDPRMQADSLTGNLTTPDVLSLHRQLAALHRAGARAVALEASSIGLEQGRLDGVQVDVAAFTNLTHDHLDYHRTMQAYQKAKFCLFERADVRHAVVNIDDAAGQELVQRLAGKNTPAVHTYALHNSAADFRARDVRTGANRSANRKAAGTAFTLVTPDAAVPAVSITTQVIGQHNIANLLLVAAVLSVLQKQGDRLGELLGNLGPVDGRMQTVQWPGGQNATAHVNAPLVVVDYAHTPDALAHALQALRPTALARGGKLHCVFGCGGDRDRSKRPVMGTLAQQHADGVVLTSDNPRGENPLAILDDIRSGMKAPPQAMQPDRALAILAAIWQAQPADVVLIAGKGHETYQEVHGQRLPFDDRVWAQLALALADGSDSAAMLHTDTRTLQAGQLFVALAGENFDGHDWLDAARRAGACAALVSRVQSDCPLPQLLVHDTRAALGKLGQAWRARWGGNPALPLVAVTGSNGKTTVKEMLAGILRTWRGYAAVLATHGNLNNDLGVPLTLLRLRREHRAAVVELGMNHAGEIAPLAAMAQPTIALVNNAQREHQEFMGSVDAVAQENARVFAALDADGIAVYPGDDPYTGLWDSLCGHCRVLRFGWRAGDGIAVYAQAVQASPQQPGQQRFTLCVVDEHLPDVQQVPVCLNAPGLHSVRNALAAAACAHAAGVPLAVIAAGLADFGGVAGRMQTHPWCNDYLLVDDTYNANPESVLAAIDVLAALPGRRQLVLGDMGEVGAHGAAMHEEVGAYAHQQGVQALFTLGPLARHAARAFERGGKTQTRSESPVQAQALPVQTRAFADIDALIGHVQSQPPCHTLVKGSRVMRMERVVQALLTQGNGKKHQNQETRHAA